MKKLVSLAVLSVLVAGCMDDGYNNNAADYGYGDLVEEQLNAGPDSLNNDAYLMAAAPKYYIGNPYNIGDVQYIPSEDLTYNQTGIAGIVPFEVNGKKTKNDEIFDSNQMVASSKTLPLPSIVRVTNLDNGESVVVRVNYRGPINNARIMDLSAAAARKIGLNGTAKVQIQVLAEESLAVKKATLGETAKVEPVAAEPAPAAEPVASGEYSVQVAAVYSEDNANALVNELSSYGHAVVVHEADMYKVRIIDLDAANARKVIDALRSDKGMAPGLLKDGKWVNADSI